MSMKAWLAELLESFRDWLLTSWLALLELAEWLHEMSADWPPLSWAFHGLLALPVACLGALFFAVAVALGLPPLVAAGLASSTSFYLWRELEQIAHRILAGAGLDPLDHVMDVAVPVVFVIGTWLAMR